MINLKRESRSTYYNPIYQWSDLKSQTFTSNTHIGRKVFCFFRDGFKENIGVDSTTYQIAMEIIDD